MAQQSFVAAVEASIARYKERRRAVFQEAVQRTLATAQTPVAKGGRMRVDTGFLRASLYVTLGDALPPQQARPEGIEAFRFDEQAVNLTIADADTENTITAVWTANYARPREYGARGQEPDRFVGLAAQQWPRIVAEVAAEVRARTGG